MNKSARVMHINYIIIIKFKKSTTKRKIYCIIYWLLLIIYNIYFIFKKKTTLVLNSPSYFGPPIAFKFIWRLVPYLS